MNPRRTRRQRREIAACVTPYVTEALERRVLLSLIPVGNEFLVNTTTTNIQALPDVAMDADGNFVVAWESPQDGSSWGTYAQRYASDGSPQGPEFRANTYTTNAQFQPAVAMDADGDFVITWHSFGQDGSDYGVYAQRFNALAVPQGAEFRVNTSTASVQARPDIAMDSDGDFVIVWDSRHTGFYQIYGQRYSSAGISQGAEFLITSTPTGPTNVFSTVAMDADGDFVVAWQRNNDDVFARRYNSAGVAQGAEFRVNTLTVGIQDQAAVAMDADGDFVVSWTDDFEGDVYAQRYNSSGVAQGAHFRVNTFTTGIHDGPAVATDADGDFVVAWNSGIAFQPETYDIFARQYNAAGVAQGTEFRVNTYTIADQEFASVAMDADGDAVIAWTSEDQDGSGYGVYAQRYLMQVTWTGAAGDNLWTTAGNWSTNAVPGPDDDVLISVAANPSINLNSGTQVINSLISDELLSISGAATTLQVNTTATLGNTLTLAGGKLKNATVNGTGMISTTSADGTLDSVSLGVNLRVVPGAVVTVLNGLILMNNPTVSLESGAVIPDVATMSFSGTQTLGGTGSVVFNGASSLLNNVGPGTTGQTLTIGSGITVRTGTQGGNIGGIGSGGVVNQGTISAQTSLGTIEIRVPNTNNGSYVATNGGRLTVQVTPTNFSGGTLTGGTWRVGGNSTMRLANTNIATSAATISLEGANANIYNATSGTTSALANFATNAAAGNFTIAGGATFSLPATFTNDGQFIVGPGSTLNLSSGTFTGSGDLSISGTMDWTGGTMSGTGRTFVGAGGAMTIGRTDASTTENLQRVLEVAMSGSVTAVAANFDTDLNLSGGTISVLSGGLLTFDNTGSGDININNTAGANLFNNSGTVNKTGPANSLARVNVPFNTTGIVSINAGDLSLAGGGSYSGSLVVNGTLNFTGGSHALDGVDVSGTGAIYIGNVSTSFTFNAGAYNVGVTGIIIGGTATFNAVASTGILFINDGTVTGSGDLTITAPSGSSWIGGTMSGTGKTIVASGAFIQIHQPGAIPNSLQRTLENHGTVSMTDLTASSAGTYSQVTGLTLVTGTITAPVNIQAGNLSASGTINGNVQNAGTIAPGASPGSLSINGDLTLTSTSQLVMELGGPTAGTEFDVINVSGAVTLDGSLTANLINSYDPAPGTMLPVVVGASRTGTFSSFSGGPTPSGHPLAVEYDSTSARVTVPIGQAGLWTGAAGDGLWNTPGNWSNNMVPGPSDDVVINLSGTYTVTLTGTAASVESLTLGGASGVQTLDMSVNLTLAAASTMNTNGVFRLSSGTLDGAGDLAVAGAFNWIGGTMGTGGGMTIIASGAALTVTTNTSKSLRRTIENHGTFTWSNVAATISVIGGTFNNLSDGTYGSGSGASWVASGGTNAFNNFGQVNHGISTFNLPVMNAGTWNKNGTGAASGNSPFNNTGTLNVNGGTFTLSGAVTNNGTFEVSNGAAFTISTTPTNFSGGTLTGGIWRVIGTSSMRLAGTNIVTNAATIVRDGAGANIYNATTGTTSALAPLTTNAAAGSLTLTNGRNQTVVGALSNAGAIIVGPGSTLTVGGAYTQTAGSTTLAGGTITPSGTFDIQGGGLSGSGTINANVQNAGTIAPGFSAGSISINGDLTLTSTSQLVMELGGPTPGTQFDVINGSGAVTLSGSLTANLINGYDPAPGTMLPVVVGSSRSGMFSSFSGGPTPSGHPLVDLYDATSAIVAVPVQQAPAVTASNFHFANLPQRLTFTFDQDISASFTLDDIVVQTLPGGPNVTPSGFNYDTQNNTLTVTFTGALADANYRATLLASGITNSAGTPMAADYILNFFFLRGDANHDARVNLSDFNILAANFGQSGRDFTQGDFNYDTIVNLADFNILASRFGQTIGPESISRPDPGWRDRLFGSRLIEQLGLS